MFIAATLVLYLVMLLVRGTLPRYRIDLLVIYVWKILLYFSLALIILTLIPYVLG